MHGFGLFATELGGQLSGNYHLMVYDINDIVDIEVKIKITLQLSVKM